MVIIIKGRSSRVENQITYGGSNRGGGGNIITCNVVVVLFFQNTTISKTYVDYFTIIISGKTDKHNRCLVAYLRVKNLYYKMLEKFMLLLHEPFRLLYLLFVNAWLQL